MTFCHLTSLNKEWDSDVYHICSSEEKQPVDPALSLLAPVTILTQQALDSCPIRNSTSTDALQTLQNTLHLGLLASGREVGSDHLRLSAGFLL